MSSPLAKPIGPAVACTRAKLPINVDAISLPIADDPMADAALLSSALDTVDKVDVRRSRRLLAALPAGGRGDVPLGRP